MGTPTYAEATTLREFIALRGLRHDWIAQRIGVTKGHFTRLLDGERRWLPRHVDLLVAALGEEVRPFIPISEDTNA